MIRLRFGPDALGHVRFAISPLVEAVRSVTALDDPGSQALHLPWVIEARRALVRIDLSMLRALLPPDRYSPDFFQAPPTGPLVEFDDEIERMVALPPEQVRAEVLRTYPDGDLPPVLADFDRDPPTALAALADLLRGYWDATLVTHWPRIRAVLEGDILYRARQMADGGAQSLFADVDPTVRWADGMLEVDKSAEQTVDLEDRGLLLVPSVFTWPCVALATDPRWQPTLVYPARGVGMLWDAAPAQTPDALAALLGRGRATILTALDVPRSTTDLARSLGVSPGGVSQHLTVLRQAGLVRGHRVGRSVVYLRSPAGDGLVGAPAASA